MRMSHFIYKVYWVPRTRRNTNIICAITECDTKVWAERLIKEHKTRHEKVWCLVYERTTDLLSKWS